MKNEVTLKGLQTQLAKVSGEAELLKIQLGATQKEYTAKIELKKSLEERIRKMGSVNKPIVSEHAIMRYLERVKGINIEEIKQKLLSDKIMTMVGTLGGNGQYPHEDGFSIVMRQNVITTIKI